LSNSTTTPTPNKSTTTPTPDKPTTNDTEEVKTSKTEKWFSTKLNKGFFQGLSFSQDLSSSQVPQIFIITDFSNESLDLGVKLREKNDIVLYYNTKNNEIEYLYGQQNDIEVERIKYQIITNGKVVNTLIEDIDSSEYVVNADQDPEDEIDAEAIVAQLQQVITQRRASTIKFDKDAGVRVFVE
jgi:hypothetical protein